MRSRRGLDQVKGVVRARDVLLALGDSAMTSGEFDVASIADRPLFVPLFVAPSSILHQLGSQHVPMVFAVDEYGGIEGIVTPTDILRALTGITETLAEAKPRAQEGSSKLFEPTFVQT